MGKKNKKNKLKSRIPNETKLVVNPKIDVNNAKNLANISIKNKAGEKISKIYLVVTEASAIGAFSNSDKADLVADSYFKLNRIPTAVIEFEIDPPMDFLWQKED